MSVPPREEGVPGFFLSLIPEHPLGQPRVYRDDMGAFSMGEMNKLGD